MSGTARRRGAAVAAAPTTAIAITTGANLRRARAIAMTMMRGRSDVVPATNGKGQTGMEANAIMIPVGPNATPFFENAIVRVRDAFTRHLHLPRGLEREHVLDRDRSCHLCAAPNRGRSLPLATGLLEWCPVVIFATTTVARLTRAPATCDTYANKG